MFTSNDKVLIFAVRVHKGWGAQKTVSKFFERNWKLSSLSKLIDEAGSHGRAEIVKLSSDADIFVKHVMNDITKDDLTKNIYYQHKLQNCKEC